RRPVRGVCPTREITGAHEAVGEDAGGREADAEELRKPTDRGDLLISEEVDRPQLLHRDVEVPPPAGGRGQQRTMDLLVGREGFVDGSIGHSCILPNYSIRRNLYGGAGVSGRAEGRAPARQECCAAPRTCLPRSCSPENAGTGTSTLRHPRPAPPGRPRRQRSPPSAG